MAAVTGAAQFGASVFGGIAQMREAKEMRRRRERAARYARADAREDLQFASRQLDSEEQGMRLDATVTQRGMDIQERALGDMAMEEHGMGMVSQSMRGVGGEGTLRSFQRGLNQSARAFQGLGLERTAAFGRERRAMEMMNLSRDQMFTGFDRQSRDISAFEDDTRRDFKMQVNAARDSMIAGAIEGATTAGLMMWRGGAFMKKTDEEEEEVVPPGRAEGNFARPTAAGNWGTPHISLNAAWGTPASPPRPQMSEMPQFGSPNYLHILAGSNAMQASPMLNLGGGQRARRHFEFH